MTNYLVSLLFLSACLGVSSVQAQTSGSVVAWSDNEYSQANVPVAAQSGVTAIAAGAYHLVALKIDGSVVAWGNNFSGQTNVPAEAQSGVMAIAAGDYHTVALKTDGSVVDWGYYQSGQILVPVAAQSGVTAIAAGPSHTVALKTDGSVIGWGYNFSEITVPVSARSGVIAIAVGGSHTVALKNNGRVVAWGNNDYGQTTVPVAAQSGVTAIAAGDYHTVALKNDGSVIAWGAETNNGGFYNSRNFNYGQTIVPVVAQSGVMAIAAGGNHTVALKNDGSVITWGGADYTSSGFGGGVICARSPVPVVAQSGVMAIAAAGCRTVALVISTAPAITTQPVSQTVSAGQSASFTVAARGIYLSYQWRKDGTNLSGATGATCSLGLAQTNQVGTYTVVVSNFLGSVTSAPPAALMVNRAAPGLVVAWGDNYDGQATVPVEAQNGVTAIAAGGFHSVALTTNGNVVAWGDNFDGQTIVPVAAQSEVTAIAAGGLHTVALKTDGSVTAWGYNDYGQTTVPGTAVSEVMAIAAGDYHTVALKSDGSVVAWGVGTNSPAWWFPRYFPDFDQSFVPVAAQSGVTAIAAGAYHTVALKNDGSVVAWGNNSSGQTNVPVEAKSGVTAIVAGAFHTVALKSDGSVVAWGDNAYAQTNVPVTAQSGVTAIAAGGFHTVALKNDGSVVTWGDQTTVPAGLGQVIAIATGEYHTVALVNTSIALKFVSSGNTLLLTWPSSATGFTLQSTPDLTPPVTWAAVTNAPVLFGAQWKVTNTFSGGAQFFRLRKP